MAKSKEQQECLKAYNEFNQVRNFEKEIPNCVWGDGDIVLPDKPSDPTSIDNYGLPKKKRKFPYYSKEFKEEMDSLPDDSPVKEEFLEKEWDRRMNGYWWYNGDKLEFINGHYYMTLQYWLIQVEKPVEHTGNPYFVDMHRDMNLAIWWTKRNKNYSGTCYIGARRSSKTVIGMANGYWDTTERFGALFGIQSKTFPDAKGVLRKLVSSWKMLPKFLRPSDTRESTVTERLRFSEPKRKMAAYDVYSEYLNSMIRAFPSKEEAMDGERTTYQFIDEYGKCVESDVSVLQKITKVCCMVGSKIIGYSFWATTVEEMDRKGGANAKKVWDRSDPRKANDIGRTPTTMNRLFFPAYYGMFESGDGEQYVDEWGYSNVEACIDWLDKSEAGLNQEDLEDNRRKYPRNIEDCFRLKDSGNSYSKHNLIEQRIYNDQLYRNPVRRGNFIWKGGMKFTEVEFRPDPDGRWLVAWEPDKNDRNRYKKVGSHFMPERNFCKTGVDPYDHKDIKGSGSNGAAATIIEKHYTAPDIEMGWVCIYVNRPHSPNEFYEDILKQAIFYSSPILVENNKNGMINWLEDNGWYEFAMSNPIERDVSFRKKNAKGYPMTSEFNRNALMDVTQEHIYDHIGKKQDGKFGYCLFNELIDDWERFEPSNWTPYDLAVASGLALIACKTPKQKPKVKEFKTSDWIPQYRAFGGVSRKIR